jgi:alpha-N-arabinofuranosidase
MKQPPSTAARAGLGAITALVAVAVAVAFAVSPAPVTHAAPAAPASPDTIAIQVGQPGAGIAPTMFGIFFEDINFAADGGLYPERIKNRSFEFTEPLTGWGKIAPMETEGELVVRSDGGLHKNNPHYLRLRASGDGPDLGIANSGFRGIGVEAGAEYVLSAYVRKPDAGKRDLRATVTDERGTVIGAATLAGFGKQWKRYEARIRPSATSRQARLNLYVHEAGDLDIDVVSLYPAPADTWKGRPGGLRKDLVQLLADMKPGFLRFPGGCIVEGRRLEQRYQWKKTVGPVDERRPLVNRWSAEMGQRPAPDYFQSFGLGFFEYFQLAEDIGASPLPILNCGMACQFNSSETAALDKLGEYIQDALDLIEFANGPTGSRWGGLRARMGHPAPFDMKMIGIGNEQWGPRYPERFARFGAALKAKHPEIALVAGAGALHDGKDFDAMWAKLRGLKADIVDEHYYMPPDWFLANAGRYDRYDRKGPKVFAGEYAAQSTGVARPDNRSTWQVALAEAAFMTGLERNGDVVTMASYAPLLAHVDAWQWTPNLIWFDNLRSFGTPSYQVQKLFGSNVGTRILPVAITRPAGAGAGAGAGTGTGTGAGAAAAATANAPGGIYASATLDERTGEVIVKAVNSGPAARPVRLVLQGARGVKAGGRAIVLGSADLKAENSLDQPLRIAPVESALAAATPEMTVILDASSVTVLRVPLAQ